MVRKGRGMKRWTESEANWLREHYRELGAAECARRIGCDVERVHWKASALGLAQRGYRHWRTDEVRVMRENYAYRGAAWCADVLRRSIASVRSFARVHGIQQQRRRWTQQELDGLREVYAGKMRVRDFASRWNRSPAACVYMAGEIGIRKKRARKDR